MKLRSLLLCVLPCLALLSPVAAADEAGLDPTLPTLFIAGDSTAARSSDPDMQGWGESLTAFFDPTQVNIANRARGGRSSRTFITEGHWAKLLEELKAGDVVLIQFGHNDGGAINREPPGSDRPLRARGSLAGLGEETEAIDNAVTGQPEVVRTFGAYVREMMGDVQQRGATPVLLSPTVRDRWADGRVERGSGGYRTWSRQLAADAGIGFIDHTRLIADAYQELGETAAGTFFTKDYVHTNAEGARLNAALVVAGLKGRRGPGPDVTTWLSRTGAGVAADSIGWLNLPEPVRPDRPTLLLIGDSTVRNGGGDGANGEWGWGEPLAELLDSERINVVNRAIGGLSSRTFRTQGHWARALALAKPGDWLVMQFGHNDAAPLTDDQRARGTIRVAQDTSQAVYNLLSHQTELVHSYGGYLRRYVAEARAAGLHPVICTPVPRKRWDETGARIQRDDGPEGFATLARQVAAELEVPLIDLHEQVASQYETLGREAVDTLFADAHTHTSRAGAELNARLVAAALAELAPDTFAAPL